MVNRPIEAVASSNTAVRTSRPMRFDLLEPRMMFDGAMAADLAAAAPPPEPTADDGGAITAAPTDALPSALPSEPATQVVVFIDANVADADALAASAPAGAEIVRLTEGDGLSQIAATLDGRSNIASIHIFSHGEAGAIQLGSTLLTTDTVAGRATELQTIGGALSADGDILIYGCDVADGAGGDLLARIAAATGADVAASTDLTGAAALGGDWDLESRVGDVAARPVAAESYGGLLSISDTASAQFRVNTTILDAQSDPDVTRLADGGFVISWWSLNQDGSGYGAYGQRYDANGVAVDSEFLINTSTTNYQYKGALAGLTGGGFVATWQSQHTGTWQTMGQIFAADGTKTGGEFVVGTSGGQGAEQSVTALSDGGFLVSYEGKIGSSSEAYARRYAADGTPVADSFLLNVTTAGNQMWAVQSQLSNGNIVAVWQSNDVNGAGDHFGRIFDINGNALTGEFAINTFTANSQTYPQVTALSNGGFVATWASWYQDGDVHSDIYSQLFDASGNKVGGEFRVNTLTDSQQDKPEVTALSTGGYVVTWQTNPPGNLYVVGQVFDNSGNKIDGEFKINQTGTHSHSPAIAAMQDGRVVVAWTEYDTASVYNSTLGQYTSTQSNGIFARIFGTASNTVPTAPTIAAQTATEDSAFSYQVAAFTDPGDTLTYTATKADGSALPSWLSFNAATRTFSGTALNDDVGSVSVKVTATDTANATASATFAINVANTNDAPVSATLGDRTADVGTATTWQATAFTDVDVGDSLAYTATKGDGTALPTWLSFNATTRTFSGTPPQGSAGVIGLKVIATDLAGATASASFNLTVSDDPNTTPIANGRIPHQLVVDRQSWSMTVPSEAFSDADNDTLTLSATRADGGALPSWIIFDAATRTFSGTPGTSDVGTVDLKVIATDPAGATAAITFKVTVGNVNRPIPPDPGFKPDPKPPAEPPPAPPVRSEGNKAPSSSSGLNTSLLGITSVLGLSPNGFDAGVDSLAPPAETRVVEAGGTFQVSLGADAGAASVTLTQADGQAAPAWIKVDPATGTVSGNPPPGFSGEVVLNVVVRDADGGEVTKQIVVKVEGKSTGERSGKDRQASAKPSLGAQLGNAGRTAFVAQRQALTAAVRG